MVGTDRSSARYDHRRRARRPRWTPLALLPLLTGMAVVPTSCDRPPTDPPVREVVLGGLFDLSGEYASVGIASRAAMELAVEDVNLYLEGNAAGVRFTTVIEDVRFDEDLALNRIQAFREAGVRVVIGPPTSGQLHRIKSFVDANEILVVSPSSTAASLAIRGDNIFRFAPGDALEATAISAMMWDDGVRVIAPVWRADPATADLVEATRERFTEMGGTVLPGVEYAATTHDLSETIASLRTQVNQAIAQTGAVGVAVYLSAFEEVAQIFTAADADPVLSSVRWYGTNNTAAFESLAEIPGAAEFAARAGFPNPYFGVDESARDIWEPLTTRVRERANVEPTAYALTAYDAVWAVARGYVASGVTSDLERLKDAIITAASTGFGATGWTVLNEAGDRRHGDYDFWAITMDDGTPRWTRVALYGSRTGRLIR
jgi:branched-chain amino acid transport system substrate-binding protein